MRTSISPRSSPPTPSAQAPHFLRPPDADASCHLPTRQLAQRPHPSLASPPPRQPPPIDRQASGLSRSARMPITSSAAAAAAAALPPVSRTGGGQYGGNRATTLRGQRFVSSAWCFNWRLKTRRLKKTVISILVRLQRSDASRGSDGPADFSVSSPGAPSALSNHSAPSGDSIFESRALRCGRLGNPQKSNTMRIASDGLQTVSGSQVEMVGNSGVSHAAALR